LGAWGEPQQGIVRRGGVLDKEWLRCQVMEQDHGLRVELHQHVAHAGSFVEDDIEDEQGTLLAALRRERHPLPPASFGQPDLDLPTPDPGGRFGTARARTDAVRPIVLALILLVLAEQPRLALLNGEDVRLDTDLDHGESDRMTRLIKRAGALPTQQLSSLVVAAVIVVVAAAAAAAAPTAPAAPAAPA
jgi:hypothetical protein